MIRDILIIAQERKIFQQIKISCEPSNGKNYIFLFVQNIQAAIDLLRKRHVALVLLEQFPQKKHTLSLLSYIWKFYPDITVLNMAGYPVSLESVIVGDEGVSVQSVKMLPDNDWPEVIRNVLGIEQKGGSLYISEVSLFVQMIQQEQRTCTLRVYDDINRRIGILFFQDGELKNARLKTVHGKTAAGEVLTWKAVWIDIQNTCDRVSPQIDTNLQAILIEGQLNKDNSDEYDTTSSWIAAARIEEQYYRKLLDHIQNSRISDEKEKHTVLSRPTESARSGIFRRFIPMTVAMVLVLLSATAYYMAYHYQKDGVVKKPGLVKKGLAPAALPPSAKPSPMISNTEHRIKVRKSIQTTEIPTKRIAREKDNPASISFRKQHLLTAGPFRVKQTFPLQPFTIFLHYTHTKNRALAEQLAHYLASRGFIVQDVEQVKYNKNEIRYFGATDQEGAQTLRRCISTFLENLHPPKGAFRLNLKNLAKKYPQVPQGQMEIWLRLSPS